MGLGDANDPDLGSLSSVDRSGDLRQPVLGDLRELGKEPLSRADAVTEGRPLLDIEIAE
jgi:hypothetical protein